MEGADDADDTAAQLTARVTGVGEASSSQTTAVAAVSSDVDQSICHACDMPEPPARKQRHVNAATISWVGCDYCPRWYHRVCVGMVNDAGMDNYRCDLCI